MLIVRVLHAWQFLQHTWRTPHRLVVDIDGTSVASPTIYATYTVACWWYECRIHATYINAQCLVSHTPYDFANTEATVIWTSSWGPGVELMASNEDKLRRRRERDKLRRKTESAWEREVPTKLEGARSDIVTLLLSILAQHDRPLAHAQCTSILNAVHCNYAGSLYSVFVAITS